MERGAKRGPGRPRGTSRGGPGIGRVHSSSEHSQHHPNNQNHNHNHQSHSSPGDQSPLSPSISSHSFNLNFADQNIAEYPSHAQVRTPSSSSSSRGRGATRTFHPAAAYPSSTSSSPAFSASFPAATQAKMDIRTPRSEKLPKSSQLHHSLTFSTPSNKSDLSLRKRARTYEVGLDGAADDEAEVKGGHSLRKRARVDYAQIVGDEEENTQALNNTNIANKPEMKLTPAIASSARGRKRRANEVDYDTDDLPPSTVTKKRGRYEKQRTESPASLRRKQPQRKISTQSKSYVEQQPSDTELKDTIEVGIQYSEYESSDEQSVFKHSDTASISSDQPIADNSAEAEAAPVNQQTIESDNIAPTATQPQDAVSAPSDDKPVKTEDVASNLVRDVSEHKKSPSPPIDPALAISPTQATNDNHVSIISPSDEQQPANSVSVVKAVSETEKEVSEQVNNSSAKEELLEVTATPTEGQAPQETQTKSSTTQLNEPNLTEDQPTPQSQATEPVLANGSSSTTTAAEDTATEQPTPSQPEVGEGVAGTQELKKDLRPKGEVLLRTRQDTPKQVMGDGKIDSAHVPSHLLPQSMSPSYGLSSGGPSSRDSSVQPDVLPRTSTPPVTTLPTQLSHAEPTETRPKVGRPRGRKPKAAQSDKAYPEGAGESAAPTPVPELSEPVEERVEAVDDQADEDSQQQSETVEDALTMDPALESGANIAEGVDTPMDSGDAPSPQDTTNGDADHPTPGEPIIESMRPPKSRKKLLYERLTSPSVFIDLLKNHKDMNDADLYSCLENVLECLTDWQDEWQALKLITDDEDNAVRRRAADLAYESKQDKQAKMLQALKKKNQNGSVDMAPAVEKDFAIKGVRVKEPTYKSDKAYYRGQDQVMAQAYGFEHDPRETMISKQDPINQRDGLQNSRLRNRPKLSQRAIEATNEDPDTNIIPGKRTRRPRGVEDESQSQSRAATPVEAPRPSGRGRRRGPMPRQNTASSITTTAMAQTNGEDWPAEDEPVAAPKRGRRPGRKPKDAVATPAEEPQTEVEKPKKKRGRRSKAEIMAQQEAEGIAGPQAKRQRRGPGRPPNQRVEIPAASFYDNPSPADTEPTPSDESRPTTSSSSGTAHTAESNYSFRERKRKNYTELANVGFTSEAEPKPKRVRRNKKEPTPTPPVFNTAPATGFFSTALSNGPALAPAPPRNDLGYVNTSHPLGAPKMKIKITNNKGKAALAPSQAAALAPAPFQFPVGGPSQPITRPPSRSASAGPSKAPSGRATPAPSVGSAPPADDKDYASMTKSEKMSASMKARWANGSMQRAVDKRKETLARKKETLKAQTQDGSTPTPGAEQSQAVSSTPATPAVPFGSGNGGDNHVFPPFHAYAPAVEHHHHNGA